MPFAALADDRIEEDREGNQKFERCFLELKMRRNERGEAEAHFRKALREIEKNPIPGNRLAQAECLAYLGYQEGDFPASEDACRDVLALPMYPELAEEQQRQVIQSCAAFLRQRSRMAA